MNLLKSLSNHRNLLTISNRSIKTVTIIGCGLMGSGIAQVSAQAGYKVHLVDLNKNLLDDASKRIKSNLERIAKKKFADDQSKQENFRNKSMDLIELSCCAETAVKETDLVIEAVVENIEAKHTLWRLIDSSAPPSAIFASNTSSLSIAEIAGCTKRPQSFGGLHFFNPVPLMALVEVVAAAETSEATAQALYKFAESVGKTPVRCRDTPGFIVNRLLVPYLAEAVRMLERGDATAEDIDKAMQLGAGHPMGPFTLSDYVGLDTTKFILDGWHQKFPDNPLFAPIARLDTLVQQKKLGLKSGQGFYDYSKKKKAAAK